jgi:hypothetical protein
MIRNPDVDPSCGCPTDGWVKRPFGLADTVAPSVRDYEKPRSLKGYYPRKGQVTLQAHRSFTTQLPEQTLSLLS